MCKHCVSHAWFHKREGSEETNCLKYLLNHSLSSSCFYFFFVFLWFPLLSLNLLFLGFQPVFFSPSSFCFSIFILVHYGICGCYTIFSHFLCPVLHWGGFEKQFSLPAALLWLVLFQIRIPKDFLSRLTALWAPCKSRLCTTLVLLLIHSLLLLSFHSEKLFFHHSEQDRKTIAIFFIH